MEGDIGWWKKVFSDLFLLPMVHTAIIHTRELIVNSTGEAILVV